MANATISAPSGTQAGNFNVTVTFDVPINDFNKPNVNLIARTENGITGIDFEITGAGTDYNLFFTLPNEVEGSFSIGITGMVTPDGTSTPEGVMANTLVVMYDNTLNVNASFGTVEYRNNGAIAVPITFAEAVISPSKTICEISHVSGDNLTGVNYRLLGENTDYELVFDIPPDRTGSFRIDTTGDVFKVITHVWDNVIITPVTINYDTRVPFIENFDIPSEFSAGEVFDVVLQFSVPVTFVSPQEKFGSPDATFLDHFIFEGADLGLPNIYVSSSDTFPTLPIPETLPSNWSILSTASDESKIYLIRFAEVPDTATGIFNLTLKEGSVRGPVS